MYTSIRIRNFRGIEDLEIKDLGRVNLLVGANNVGKTSVLEALALLRMHQTGYELNRILENRGYTTVEGRRAERESLQGALESLVRAGADEFSVEAYDHAAEVGEHHEYLPDLAHRLVGRLSLDVSPRRLGRTHHFFATFNGTDGLQLYFDIPDAVDELGDRLVAEDRASYQIPITLSPGVPTDYPGPFAVHQFGPVCFFPSLVRLSTTALAKLVSGLDGTPRFGDLSQALRLFDDRFERLSVGFDARMQAPTLRVVLADQSGVLPASVLGDGARRMLEFITLLSGDKSLALIDEVDSGIYYEHLGEVWGSLRDVTGLNNSQVFATTHSWECVTAAIRIARGAPDEFRLHRLDRRREGVTVTTYDHETAEAALELNVEVR